MRNFVTFSVCVLVLFCTNAKESSSRKQKKSSRLIPSTITPSTKIFEQSKLPLLLDVRADWCTSHHTMIPIFQEIAFTFRKKITCVKMLIESFEDSDETVVFLKKRFGVDITQYPTFLLIKNNKVIAKIEETLSKDAFTSKIEKLLTT